LRKLNTQFLTKLKNPNFNHPTLIPIASLLIVSGLIWVGSPYITWGDYAPLTHANKRMYVILFIVLAWLLKFLIIDLEAPNPFQYKDSQTRKLLQNLQTRFLGALQFLKKTSIVRQGKSVFLDELPWYLLVGPSDAGKTALLANSNINFILQRRFPNLDEQNEVDTATKDPRLSKHCDWWITRDASIIDVPSHYLAIQSSIKARRKKLAAYAVLWQFFLHLIKKYRGKQGIDGIIVALPLPEIIQQNDPKQYHMLLRQLCQRFYELKKIFPQPLPCQLVITKCDLLPGFAEFFAEAGNDEIAQAWGITLTQAKQEKLADLFIQRFDMLIKRLNEQLLWRLHQERNPIARPAIKDFPLQIERIKELAVEFIKKLSSNHFTLSLQGVYLTSALQEQATSESTVLDQAINTTTAVQIFQDPAAKSRAYFIKKFITHHLPTSPTPSPFLALHAWRSGLAWSISAALIGVTAIILGKDFEHGVKYTYSVQNKISDYQLAVQQIQTPDERLINTLTLLDSLRKSAKNTTFKLDLSYLTSFYSYKSYQKANLAYQQSLQSILMPEIRNYFQDYLKDPVNKNADTVYAVLKAYLMLGQTEHFQPEFITTTLQQIAPKSMGSDDNHRLAEHAMRALTSPTWRPIALDLNAIEQTRKFLTSLYSLKLGYIILKNINNNDIETHIELGITNHGTSIFVTPQVASEIPTMFTGVSFPNIFNQEIRLAAEETVSGNWVLGSNSDAAKYSDVAASLTEQLRNVYVNNYVDIWESLLANINLASPATLAQADSIIMELISDHSALVQLLQALHANTYFDPITAASPKLQSLNLLLDKSNQSANLLYQIFAALQGLHQYIQTVITAQNEKKAAFDIIADHIKNPGQEDAIVQVLSISARSPEPIKNWLEKLANDTWHLLMKDASHYLDISWQENVIHAYQNDIADRYPFSNEKKQEVDLEKFTQFFGNPGIVLNFYNQYLQPLVDTSQPNWQWKSNDRVKLPLSDKTLQQIQQAIQIHHAFFPNDDNKLFVQFALQPYQIDKNIKTVKLNINDKQILDDRMGAKMPHVIAWPSNPQIKMTSVQLTLANQKTISHDFPGAWGWFALVNQSLENMVSHKEMVLNLASNDQPVKYLLFTDRKLNPFLSLDLSHFQLPAQLTDNG